MTIAYHIIQNGMNIESNDRNSHHSVQTKLQTTSFVLEVRLTIHQIYPDISLDSQQMLTCLFTCVFVYFLALLETGKHVLNRGKIRKPLLGVNNVIQLKTLLYL